jgi:hypothetical protein
MFVSVPEHFAILRHEKRCKTCISGLNALFRVPKLESIHSTPLEPKWFLVVFRSISLTFGTLKMENLCFGPQCTISRYRSCEASILLNWNQNDVWECSEYFANLRHIKRWKTCVLVLNALFRGTEVAKHPFYSIGTKMMFGSVLEHFANLRHVKRCKTCVSGPNELFRGTEVATHLFYSIGTKMMFRIALEHFTNLLHVTRSKACVSSLNALFLGTKDAKHPFTPLESKWCLGLFGAFC